MVRTGMHGTRASSIYVGTAGWTIAPRHADRLPGPGTHLERYARVLNCAEINSSFYRAHKSDTYERWGGSVHDGFRFSIKLPKEITHECRLVGCDRLMRAFLDQVEGLGGKLGVLLVQLPPQLEFKAAIAETFFAGLREASDVAVACEPRNARWFSAEAEDVFARFRVARVAADPRRTEYGGSPAGWPGVAYFRMHGAPRMYHSDYDDAQLDMLRERMLAARRSARHVWCIFDNTAASYAVGNAVTLVSCIAKLRAAKG